MEGLAKRLLMPGIPDLCWGARHEAQPEEVGKRPARKRRLRRDSGETCDCGLYHTEQTALSPPGVPAA